MTDFVAFMGDRLALQVHTGQNIPMRFMTKNDEMTLLELTPEESRFLALTFLAHGEQILRNLREQENAPENWLSARSSGVLDIQGYLIEEGDGLVCVHTHSEPPVQVVWHNGACYYGKGDNAPLITDALVQEKQLCIVSSTPFFLRSEREE